MQATWIVQRTSSRRFPFRIAIEQGGLRLLAVRAQSPWPGPGQQIFCLREDTLDPAEPLEPLETAPVAHLARVGRKLAIVLDRPHRKRCEFLSVTKAYRDREGTYEQVFFRTESGIRAHRSRTKLELDPPTTPLRIAVDSAERYPWRFAGATLVRRRLPVGDYALLYGDTTVAVVERKSFDNLLGDLGAPQALHHHWADLSGCPVAAVVVEAQFADFVDQKRLGGRWPAGYVARALAELSAMHPKLPIVFAGNRKLANLWTQGLFVAHQARQASPELEWVREVGVRYDPVARTAGVDEQIRTMVRRAMPAEFALSDLASRLPGVAISRIRRVVGAIRAEGRLYRAGSGRDARWVKVNGLPSPIP